MQARKEICENFSFFNSYPFPFHSQALVNAVFRGGNQMAIQPLTLATTRELTSNGRALRRLRDMVRRYQWEGPQLLMPGGYLKNKHGAENN